MSNYIAMCREAKEIQGRWEPKEGDGYVQQWQRDSGEMAWEARPTIISGFMEDEPVYWDGDCPKGCNLGREPTVWLPRIEDLVEMLPKRTTWFENLFRLYEWIGEVRENPFDSPIQKTESTRELWLTFAMHELYHKTWDGKVWGQGDSDA